MTSSPTSNAQNLKNAEAHGVTVAQVLEVDPAAGILMQEYVEGFTVKRLLDRRQEPELSEEEYRLVRRAFDRVAHAHYDRYPKISFLPQNVVLELRTGRFVLVDPH